jgi:hypothetical protein
MKKLRPFNLVFVLITLGNAKQTIYVPYELVALK